MQDAGKEWALEVEDLTVAYDDQPVLWDVDLQVPAGVKMAIIGPNGAGKSTLVKATMGLVRPVAGEVRIFGQPRESAQGQIAYVPQRATLSWDFPTDVLDVVTMGTYGRLGWFHRSGAVQRQQAEAALEQVGMTAFLKRPIAELSGGQQQRILLGRALVQDAPINILDEPFQGVDAPTERAIIDVLDGLGKDDHRRAPRPADRPRVLRLGAAAQREGDRLWSSERGLHRRQLASDLRRAGRRS